MDFKEAKRMARFSQVGVAAAKMAIDQSGLELAKEDRTRIGCEVGTGIGGFKEISGEIQALAPGGEAPPDRSLPLFLPRVVPKLTPCQHPDPLRPRVPHTPRPPPDPPPSRR